MEVKLENINLLQSNDIDALTKDDKNEINSIEEDDEYSYTKLNDFTSEIFKIEIGNLPKFLGYGQLRKLLNITLNLNCCKIKAMKNMRFAFVTFRNENDRDVALKKVNGYKYKGNLLTAKKSMPAADPMAKKRKSGDSEDSTSDAKKFKEDLPIEIKLKNAVTPFWNIPYEEQLKTKQSDIEKFLVQLGKKIRKVNEEAINLLIKYRNENDSKCCSLAPIKPSPSLSGYRNKCEFTAGRHLYTNEKTVGFRLNRYRDGSMSVAEPDDCINISKAMLKAVKSFENYIRNSEKDVYNPETHAGYWKQLTVRTSNNSDILLIIVMHPHTLSEDDLIQEKTKIKEYYETGPGSNVGITSVFLQLFDQKKSSEETNRKLFHLFGKKFVEETLLGMKFQISPEAFFQINVAAAEILYQVVADYVAPSSSTQVLDICCGTGTISLYLAKIGCKVLGIEMCKEAIENAKTNAENNGIENVEFICGKAEDVIYRALTETSHTDIVAVVNPPRAGLHYKVLKAIRASAKIKKLIYISCSANAALGNFVDLCRASSNNYKGSPFYPTHAAVIDLFPHTPHKELVLVFQRTCDIII